MRDPRSNINWSRLADDALVIATAILFFGGLIAAVVLWIVGWAS